MSDPPLPTDMSSFACLVKKVAAQEADRQLALVEQHAAEAELVEAMVTVLAPTLSTLASRILHQEDDSGDLLYRDERGFCLATAENAGKGRDYAGHKLYLLEDRTLVLAKYAGLSERGKQSRWYRIKEWNETTAEELVRAWPFRSLLAAINSTLESHLAGNAAAASDARERAAMLRAATALLKNEKRCA